MTVQRRIRCGEVNPEMGPPALFTEKRRIDHCGGGLGNVAGLDRDAITSTGGIEYAKLRRDLGCC